MMGEVLRAKLDGEGYCSGDTGLPVRDVRLLRDILALEYSEGTRAEIVRALWLRVIAFREGLRDGLILPEEPLPGVPFPGNAPFARCGDAGDRAGDRGSGLSTSPRFLERLFSFLREIGISNWIDAPRAGCGAAQHERKRKKLKKQHARTCGPNCRTHCFNLSCSVLFLSSLCGCAPGG